MDFSSQFEIIRPYHDHEVKGAIERVLMHPHFKVVLGYLYENKNINALVKQFKEIETVAQFQAFFSSYTVKRIVDKSSGGLSSRGVDNLSPEVSYLFIANHRDIVLDAAIMQYLLLKNGHKTSQITFGQNLMSDKLLLDLGKLNKMFTFCRGGTRIEQYNNAQLYSAYINHVINEQKESVWIAQRNGRTKDGDDKTQSGLIRMLIAGADDITIRLEGLNIVPVTISYEKEPCDIQKIHEMFISQTREYVKDPNEDLMSILSGITEDKGRINFSFGQPLNGFIKSLVTKNYHNKEIIRKIVNEIDRQVHSDYKLWPGNYIACDIINNSTHYSNQYSDEDKRGFIDNMNQKIKSSEDPDHKKLEGMYLHLYAKPVYNMEEHNNKN